MSYTEKISNKLNELLMKNLDARNVYSDAAEYVDSKSLKRFFNDRAVERAEFAKELKIEILRYGENPAPSGSITGLVHRNWVFLKSLLSFNDEKAILEEAIKGEEASLEEYKNVIEERDLPETIYSMLRKQKEAIQSAIDTGRFREELVS